jgi:hypothetical protein
MILKELRVLLCVRRIVAVENVGSVWATTEDLLEVDFSAEGTEFAEVGGRTRNGSKDPPLPRQERGWCERTMGNGSRVSYHLSIDLLFTE